MRTTVPCLSGVIVSEPPPCPWCPLGKTPALGWAVGGLGGGEELLCVPVGAFASFLDLSWSSYSSTFDAKFLELFCSLVGQFWSESRALCIVLPVILLGSACHVVQLCKEGGELQMSGGESHHDSVLPGNLVACGGWIGHTAGHIHQKCQCLEFLSQCMRHPADLDLFYVITANMEDSSDGTLNNQWRFCARRFGFFFVFFLNWGVPNKFPMEFSWK